MDTCIRAYSMGATKEDIQFMCDNALNTYQCLEYQLKKKYNLTQRQVDFLLRDGFTSAQVTEGALGFLHGLSETEVYSYYRKRVRTDMMHKTRITLEHPMILNWLKLPGFNFRQENFIYAAFDEGLSIDQIKYIYRKDFTQDQMFEAMRGFNDGLSERQISVYYKKEIWWEIMRAMRHSLNRGLTHTTIEHLMSDCTNKQIYFMLYSNESVETLNYYHDCFVKGYTIEQLVKKHDKT